MGKSPSLQQQYREEGFCRLLPPVALLEARHQPDSVAVEGGLPPRPSAVRLSPARASVPWGVRDPEGGQLTDAVRHRHPIAHLRVLVLGHDIEALVAGVVEKGVGVGACSAIPRCTVHDRASSRSLRSATGGSGLVHHDTRRLFKLASCGRPGSPVAPRELAPGTARRSQKSAAFRRPMITKGANQRSTGLVAEQGTYWRSF
jgi:hypothetical protein